MKVTQGNLIAKGLSFAVVIARFNEFISSRLLDGAKDTLLSHGAEDEDISVFRVPGSFEIPPVAAKLARSKKYDGIICLGTIIKGDTPHFDYVSSEAAKGVAHVALNENVPCIFGIITADNLEQAIERAGTKAGNRGRDAALSAIEMVNLFAKLK